MLINPDTLDYMQNDRPPKPDLEWDELFATTDPTREIWRFTKAGKARCVVAREQEDNSLEIRVREGQSTVERRTFRSIESAESYLKDLKSELEGDGWTKAT